MQQAEYESILKSNRQLATLIALFLTVVSSGAAANLIDRGIGVIYDDDLDVSWLQDANYALTSGYTLITPRSAAAPPPRRPDDMVPSF